MDNKLSPYDRRRVAIKALCDVRSVNKYLRGGELQAMLRVRVEAAMRGLGFGSEVRG
jgi:hypothetical protein